MNEVSSVRGVNTTPVAPASSKGAVTQQDEKSVETGKQLPLLNEVADSGAVNAENKEDQKTDSFKDLGEAVESMNSFVQTVQRDIQFAVDEDLDRTVVKVLDSESGDLIRQIPEQSFLELARKMKEYGEVRLIDAMS